MWPLFPFEYVASSSKQLGTLQAVLLRRPILCQKPAVTKIHQPPFVLGSRNQVVLRFVFSTGGRAVGRAIQGPQAWVGGCSSLTLPCVLLASLRLTRAVPLTFRDICSSLLLPSFSSHSSSRTRQKQSGWAAGRFHCFVKDWKFFQRLMRSSKSLSSKS